MKKIVFLGDSITDAFHKMNVDEEKLGNGYVKIISEKLKERKKQVFIRNAGHDGFTVSGLLRLFEYDCMQHDPDLVSIQIGCNDAAVFMNTGKTLEAQEFAENYVTGRGDNSVPIFRYGEVLLNYAEAKAELGEMTKDIWNETIGALRERVGVTNIYPEDPGYVEDTWLKDYYARAEGAAVTNLSNIILEIRRERVCEMMLEALRSDDLYRWHCANLIVDRDGQQNGWKGLYLTADEVKNGMTFNGYTYTFNGNQGTEAYNYAVSTSGGSADRSWGLTEGDHGCLVYYMTLKWEERMYVRPIPTSALSLNPNLTQNYGWEK